jgi:hypothetical protein
MLMLLKVHLVRLTVRRHPVCRVFAASEPLISINSWKAEGKGSPFAPCAEKIAYIIFTGPRSSFMVWNAGVFFLVVSQWPSGYSRINCTVKKLPRMTLES